MAVALVVGLGAAAVSHARLWRLPDRHNPWAPLRIDEAPGWLTRYKLRRLDAQPAACLAVLASAAGAMKAEPVPDRVTSPGCGFSNAVRVQRTSLQLTAGFVLSCRSAVSLALWERHVVHPAAARWLAAPLQQLQHFGSYACRNIGNAGSVGGADTGARSRHATADALDVSGFVLQGGRRISVAQDWNRGQGDAAEARFLRAVHDGACDYFDGVLGPGYNAAHADHLHLDRGPFKVCR